MEIRSIGHVIDHVTSLRCITCIQLPTTCISASGPVHPFNHKRLGQEQSEPWSLDFVKFGSTIEYPATLAVCVPFFFLGSASNLCSTSIEQYCSYLWLLSFAICTQYVLVLLDVLRLWRWVGASKPGVEIKIEAFSTGSEIRDFSKGRRRSGDRIWGPSNQMQPTYLPT